MARQHVEYKVPGTDKDSGEEDLTAIKPVADGEPAQASVFKRPSENLRTRTEIIRDELEDLKFLSDSDKAMLLTSSGSVTWAGLPTGTFTASANMTLRPFLAPAASTASRLIIGAGTASQITIRTRQDGAAGQPRAYNGANTISFDFTPLADNPILITVDGTPANNFHVRYDSNPATGTTNAQLIAALQANIAFTTTWGLEAVMEGGGVPAEVGFPVPPVPVGSDKVIISGPEQLLRFMSGAADAEHHVITPAQLTAFFGDVLNTLIEGDVVAVRYDALVMSPTYGGRRQSLNEAAEGYTALNAGANLFLLRRFTDRIPGALPLCAVVNGTLIFVNGRSFISGETGPLVAAGASYQGSPAAPNSWADSTIVAGPVSFESALDTVIQTLGKTTAASGANKIGFANTGNISATNVQAALVELDTEKASLGLPNNTFTNSNTFAPTVATTPGLTATGNTTGQGVVGIGGATDGVGGRFTGGGTNGGGVEGIGKGTGGRGGYFVAENIVVAAVPGSEGVRGQGGTNTGAGLASGGIGVYGQGGDALTLGYAGPGGSFAGGANGGNGVVGQGFLTGTGVYGGSGGSMNAAGGIFASFAGTTGPGVYSTGSGTGPGLQAQGGSSSNSYGVIGTSNGPYGNGVLGQGVAEGLGVAGVGGTNTLTTGNTNGVTPVSGPGTGVVGIGATGLGGGDGGQFFARMGVGSTASRSGVLATGSYSQTTGIPGGAGSYATGGGATVGNANGGVGSVGIGGPSLGTGQAGQGGIFQGGTGPSDALGNSGVRATGSGIHDGVWGTGGGASGTGVFGLGGAPNGVGVVGTGVGTGAGVRGFGAPNGHGVHGVGGSTVGYGVYGIAQVSGWSGVFGDGKGTASGVTGRGDVAGIGTTTLNVLGGYFLGGPGANTGATSRGGLGAQCQGGDPFLIPGGSSFAAYYAGNGGDGLQANGGSGFTGGVGVVGFGGTAYSNSDTGGEGQSGPGGYFQGGAGDGSTAITWHASGHGLHAIGGAGVNSAPGGHGVVCQGGGSDAGPASYGFAVYAGQGHIKLAGGNPAIGQGFANVLTPKNVIKAWGRITTGPSPTLVAGFNIDPAGFSYPPTAGFNLQCTFLTGMADTSYFIVATGGSGNQVFAENLGVATTTTFSINGYSGGAVITNLNSVSYTILFIVIGIQ